MSTDKNPEVCFVAMYALYPSYNINKEWAEKKYYIYMNQIFEPQVF